MKFWDSSALVPLVVEESRSNSCRRLLAEDRVVVVWALTRTEIVSAIRRKQRHGELSRDSVQQALQRVRWLEEDWIEVDVLPLVRDRADRLLAVHPLRAADALQLAAALILCHDRPAGLTIVTSDDRLIDAASAEGFLVQTPATVG